MDYVLLQTILLAQEAQSPGSIGLVENIYKLIREGGLLMGALFVIFGMHKFYRYMIDKLEEKHVSQIAYLEGQLEELSRESRERTRQDTQMIRDLTRNIREGT